MKKDTTTNHNPSRSAKSAYMAGRTSFWKVTAQEHRELSRYLREEIGEYIPLSPEEEKRFFQRAQAGDTKTMDWLILNNTHFAVEIAKQYAGRGVPLMDLVQEATMGVMLAAKKFDPERGYRFTTFAAHDIHLACERLLEKMGMDIPVAIHVQEATHQLVRAEMNNERDKPNLSPSMQKRIEQGRMVSHTRSLDAPLSASLRRDTGDPMTLADILEDKEGQDTEGDAIQLLMNDQLREIMPAFLARFCTPREVTVVTLYHGIGRDELTDTALSLTFEQIGKQLGITKRGVTYHYHNALRKLRNALEVARAKRDRAGITQAA